MRRRSIMTREQASNLAGLLATYLGVPLRGDFAHAVVRNSQVLAKIAKDTKTLVRSEIAGTKVGDFFDLREAIIDRMCEGKRNILGDPILPPTGIEERIAAANVEVEELKTKMEVTDEDLALEQEARRKVLGEKVDAPLLIVPAKSLPDGITPAVVEMLLPMIEEE